MCGFLDDLCVRFILDYPRSLNVECQPLDDCDRWWIGRDFLQNGGWVRDCQ